MLNFSKRINGRTYYAGILLLILGTLLLIGVSGALVSLFGPESDIGSTIGLVIFIIMIFYVLIYGAALVRQRANDISGSHPLLIFVVLYFTPLFLLGGLFPGEKHANRYGAVPDKGFHLI